MLDLKKRAHPEPKGLSPVSLAFVGDGVFELLVRERLIQNGNMPAAKLHHLAVCRVKATAQAAAFEAVSEVCSEEELDILRRGRNVSLSRLPQSCTPEQYHKATAVEALFGYLYLAGHSERLQALFDLVEEVTQREDSESDKG